MTAYRQFELHSGDNVIVVWLEDDARLVPGRTCTLKKTGPVVWTVAHRYAFLRSSDELRKPWKVGGLD